ncbi:uncharacterized protein [Phaseolus vulgaris]|uniref:uncharacterized protein n=1 Tax=Phaseolus vulgaris TaxID=3885 RepID=UPI0035CA6ADE
MAEKLRFPPKSNRNLGSRKEAWYEFHKGFGHDVEHCIALGYQLASLIKDGFLKEYLEGSQEGSKKEITSAYQGHEVPVHGELNTISGGFSGGGCSASKLKKYMREVMAVEAQGSDQPTEPDLCFTNADLGDVVPHEDDPVVISIVTVGRKVHRVLIDQGSSTDVMFWVTFHNLQLSPDQLRPYDGCLFGFVGDQVEVRGHVELRTTFSNGVSSCTISIRNLVVNVVSAYNLFLGRSSLNRLGTVASRRHMKMKLPSLEGEVIIINLTKRRRGSATRIA